MSCNRRLTNFQTHLVVVNRHFCYDLSRATAEGLNERMNVMILAEKIMSLRKKNGWSQEELAEHLDISRQSVSKWESAASIPDLDKILKMSSLFGVSTDYLLKDDIEEETPSEGADVDEAEGKVVSLEEANAYMNIKSKLAPIIATAVSLCIASPICLIILGAMSEEGRFSENIAGGIGTAILLVFVAIAVGIFITTGFKCSKYEYIEREKLSLQYGVKGAVELRKKEYDDAYKTYTAIGVVLCIVGVIPLILMACFENASAVLGAVMIGVLLLFVSVGVNFLVRSSMINESYEQLLQTGDFTEENKKFRLKTAYISGAYWCISTAVYLAWSFLTNDWEITWLVWPVAGVLFAAFIGILKIVFGVKKKD